MEATSKFMNTDIFSFSSINEIFFFIIIRWFKLKNNEA